MWRRWSGFTQVINRLAIEFSKEAAARILTLLASARRGLSERELQDLLTSVVGHDDLFPIMRQLRSYLHRFRSRRPGLGLEMRLRNYCFLEAWTTPWPFVAFFHGYWT